MCQTSSVGLLISIFLTSSWPWRLPARKSGLFKSSIEYLTSSAVKGAPSCHLTPSRSLIVQVRPSAETPPFSTVGTSFASCGMKLPLGSTPQSGL